MQRGLRRLHPRLHRLYLLRRPVLPEDHDGLQSSRRQNLLPSPGPATQPTTAVSAAAEPAAAVAAAAQTAATEPATAKPSTSTDTSEPTAA